MNPTAARRALTDSTLALVLACLSAALFLPPMLEHTLSSVLRIVATGLTLTTALLAHWWLLARGAQLLGRAPAGWLGMSVLLFPVGGAASLLLLSWQQPPVRSAAALH